MNENTYSPVKWLQYLLYAGIASAANTLLLNIPQLTVLSTWLGYALSGVTIFLLFRLVAANARYKTAAICFAVALGCALINNTILALVGSICGIVAQYQEYHGHSELVEERDPRLAVKWNRLFWVQFIVGLVLGLLLSMAVVVLVMITGPEATVPTALTVAISIASLGLEVLYLVYLNRTIKLVGTETLE